MCVAFHPINFCSVPNLPHLRQSAQSFALQWLSIFILLGMSAQQIFGLCQLFPTIGDAKVHDCMDFQLCSASKYGIYTEMFHRWVKERSRYKTFFYPGGWCICKFFPLGNHRARIWDDGASERRDLQCIDTLVQLTKKPVALCLFASLRQ